MLDLRDLPRPVVLAPMAGGPSTPALVAAVTGSGALGFLAGAYLSADRVAADVEEARRLAAGPVGVNLFVPGPERDRTAVVETYRRTIAPEAERYGVELPIPRWHDDGWAAKLAALVDLRPEAVSFTFGLPAAAELTALRQAGCALVATVTTPDEARQALDAGVDALCVQGPEAGGHRGTFDADAAPATVPLDDLVRTVRAITAVPVVAAGGLMDAADVAGVLAAGADLAQLGTAFLRCPEAGTRPAHADALVSGAYGPTVVTRAFSGRSARGLQNRFVRAYDDAAPVAYPEINDLTAPLRRAAAGVGDADGLNLWAGTGHARATGRPAAELVRVLDPR